LVKNELYDYRAMLSSLPVINAGCVGDIGFADLLRPPIGQMRQSGWHAGEPLRLVIAVQSADVVL
jgi:hypothetical protein